MEGDPVAVLVHPATSVVTDGEEMAWYYLDESVVRRTENRDLEPVEGDLLECLPKT